MKAPAFSFYVRDWMCSRKVTSMSGDQVKAYVYLLCEAWLQEPRATLPTDDNELAEMARVDADEWTLIKSKVMSCFKVGECSLHEGKYYSERLLEVSNISNIRSLSKKNKTRTKIKQKPIKSGAGVVTCLEKEIEDEDILFLDWKKDFNVYLEYCKYGYNKLIDDTGFMSEQVRYYHQNLDIQGSLHKVYTNYWATEDGWNNKRKKKIKTVNWKTTFRNSLSDKRNHVWKTQ